MFLYNDPKLKIRRKELRQNETPVEKNLWDKLRNKKLGVKFFRQYSVGPYILDFYCPGQRLGIELDGGQHLKDKQYDKERDNYLFLNDIIVLRFWNKEIHANINSTLEKIKETIATSSYVRGGREELK